LPAEDREWRIAIFDSLSSILDDWLAGEAY